MADPLGKDKERLCACSETAALHILQQPATAAIQSRRHQDKGEGEGEQEEGLTSKMLSVCTRKMVLLAPLLLMMGLISTKAATAEEESGTAIPAEIRTGQRKACLCQSGNFLQDRVSRPLQFEGRPCVDCHAFEFMQRALQDLKKTAYNLDSRTEMLLFKVEKRSLCDCLATNALN